MYCSQHCFMLGAPWRHVRTRCNHADSVTMRHPHGMPPPETAGRCRHARVALQRDWPCGRPTAPSCPRSRLAVACIRLNAAYVQEQPKCLCCTRASAGHGMGRCAGLQSALGLPIYKARRLRRHCCPLQVVLQFRTQAPPVVRESRLPSTCYCIRVALTGWATVRTLAWPFLEQCVCVCVCTPPAVAQRMRRMPQQGLAHVPRHMGHAGHLGACGLSIRDMWRARARPSGGGIEESMEDGSSPLLLAAQACRASCLLPTPRRPLRSRH